MVLCQDFPAPTLMGSLLLPASYSYSYMIDNVILLITGTLHQRSIAELVPKCHPLGSFEQMEAVNIAQTPAELYNAILVDTPLGEPLCWSWEVGSGVSISASGWDLWTRWGMTLSQKVRPAHCCLPLLPFNFLLPFSPHFTPFCSCPVGFAGPGRLPQGLTGTVSLCEAV